MDSLGKAVETSPLFALGYCQGILQSLRRKIADTSREFDIPCAIQRIDDALAAIRRAVTPDV